MAGTERPAGAETAAVLRGIRGRLTWIAVVLTLILIATWVAVFGGNMNVRIRGGTVAIERP